MDGRVKNTEGWREERRISSEWVKAAPTSEQDSAPGNCWLFLQDKSYYYNYRRVWVILSSLAVHFQPWFCHQFTGFSCRCWHLLYPLQTISTGTIEGFATDLTVTMDTEVTILATWQQVSHEIIPEISLSCLFADRPANQSDNAAAVPDVRHWADCLCLRETEREVGLYQWRLQPKTLIMRHKEDQQIDFDRLL